MEKEQLEGSIADCTARVAAIEARIRIAEREKVAAVKKEDYGRADKLKIELEHIAAEMKQLQASDAECRSRLRELSLVVTADSSNAVPASAKVAAEIAGLDVKLQGLQKRLDEAKAVPAAQKDTKLIRSLKSDIEGTKKELVGKRVEERKIEEKEQAKQAAKQAAMEKQKAEEAHAYQELEERQSRERAQQAAEQKAFEDEHARVNVQLEKSDEAEDYDLVEELQKQLQALPKTLDEWRSRREKTRLAPMKAEAAAAAANEAQQRYAKAEQRANTMQEKAQTMQNQAHVAQRHADESARRLRERRVDKKGMCLTHRRADQVSYGIPIYQ